MDLLPIDIDAFRATPLSPRIQPFVPHSIRRSVDQTFIKGPIPMDWLAKAANLPVKTILVGLELWRESGCRRSQIDIPLSTLKLKVFGVGRKASYAALKRLEAAKLIATKRRNGCLSRVTILDASSSS